MFKSKSLFLLSLFIASQLFSASTKIDSVWFHYPGVGVTANRFESDVFTSHLPVTIVPEARIWETGSATLEQVFEQQPGIHVSSSGPWSEKIVLRGIEGHSLTLVDGLRVDVLRGYGSHAPLIDPDMVQRIEVVKGPASVLYGSDAVAGVVNFITRDLSTTDARWQFNTSLKTRYATVNSGFSQNAFLNGKWEAWRFLINISHQNADDINTPDGVLKNTGYNGTFVDSKLNYKFNQQHQVQVQGHISRMKDVGIPINPYALTSQFNDYNRDRVVLKYQVTRPESILADLTFKAYYQQGLRQFDASIYHLPKSTLFVNNQLSAKRNVKTWGSTLQSKLLIWDYNIIVTGMDVFAEQDHSRRTADAVMVNAGDEVMKDPPADTTPPTPKSDRLGYGIFIEDQWSPYTNVTLNMGLRYDGFVSNATGTPGTLAESNVSKTDQNISGNFGLLYSVSDEFNMTVNLGRTFKAPTLQQRFFKGSAQVGNLSGNPNLKPETSFNLDTGFKWRYEHFRGEVALFKNTIDNFIVMEPLEEAGYYQYSNIGKAELWGAELDAAYRILPCLTASLTAAYVEGEDTQMGEPLPQVPPLQGTVALRYEKKKSFWGELAVKSVQEQSKVAANELETEGTTLLNWSSGVNLGQWLFEKAPLYLTLNVYNLLDESYRDHLSAITWWVAPGRNIVVGLKTSF